MRPSEQGSGAKRPTLLPLTSRRMSMEEAWRCIAVAGNLSHHNHTNPPLFHRHHQPTTPTSSSSSSGIILQDFLAGASASPPPNPRYPLNLNSTPRHSTSDGTHHAPLIPFYPPIAKKRAPDQTHHRDDEEVTANLRQKRMMMNRESAARSRARKQAFTNELEQEVDHLLRENAKLRRQYEELRKAMETQEPTTERTLQRSSTAPF